jgi:hypothetical protein
MTRYQFIERVLRQVFGEQPSDSSNITVNLVNNWLSDAIGLAAKKNWTDNVQIDQIAFVNNSFYTTFKGIQIIDGGEQFLYQLTLPEIPLGIGRNEAISTLQFVDANGFASDPAIPLSQAQIGYFRGQRPIPNKIMYYPEGTFIYAITTLQLFSPNYTGKVKMISGGDSTNLDSTLNVPPEYFQVMTEYIKMQLSFERAQTKDLPNDQTDH